MNTPFEELIAESKPVLVDFFATWCGPCKTLAPILSQVKEAVGDQVSIIKIDVDKNQQLSSKFNVRSVPTLILFKEGKIIWRESGVVPKDEIIRTIRLNAK